MSNWLTSEMTGTTQGEQPQLSELPMACISHASEAISASILNSEPPTKSYFHSGPHWVYSLTKKLSKFIAQLHY